MLKSAKEEENAVRSKEQAISVQSPGSTMTGFSEKTLVENVQAPNHESRDLESGNERGKRRISGADILSLKLP